MVKRQSKSNLAVVYNSESDNSSVQCFTECIFLVRTQEGILWSIRFNICHVVYLLSHKKLILANLTKVLYKRGRSTQKGTEREAARCLCITWLYIRCTGTMVWT
jgi:hypothetical protein